MIDMKQMLVALFISTTLMSCGSFASTSTFMKVQKGMTQAEVTQLLGTPEHRRFDEGGEQWEFRSAMNMVGESKVVTIDFVDGRVTNMDSFTDKIQINPSVAVYPPNEIVSVIPSAPLLPPQQNRPHYRVMNDKDFQQFYNDVKRTPFKDDQLELLATGTIHNHFTSQQCVQLMAIYAFDDDKLKVVEIIAPRIVDRENYMNVMNSFTFSSSRDKAKSLFGNRPAYGVMSSDQFQRFYNNVKRESFKDDQLKAITMGATRSYFTCSQCIRLMSIFSFDDEKLKVVEILANRIVDKENSEDIVKALSFISSQDKAKALFGIKGRW